MKYINIYVKNVTLTNKQTARITGNGWKILNTGQSRAWGVFGPNVFYAQKDDSRIWTSGVDEREAGIGRLLGVVERKCIHAIALNLPGCSFYCLRSMTPSSSSTATGNAPNRYMFRTFILIYKQNDTNSSACQYIYIYTYTDIVVYTIIHQYTGLACTYLNIEK